MVITPCGGHLGFLDFTAGILPPVSVIKNVHNDEGKKTNSSGDNSNYYFFLERLFDQYISALKNNNIEDS